MATNPGAMPVLHSICHWRLLYVHLDISIPPSDRGRNANVEAVQIIGYICRVVARDHLVSIPLYALQSLMILLAPPLYAASVYMVLGRTITYLHAENLSLVPVRWMTKIFVTGDVISFLLQCGGKSLPPPSNIPPNTKLTLTKEADSWPAAAPACATLAQTSRSAA